MKIFEPTRGVNCLDNVFNSLQDNIAVSVENFHVSDHLGQLVSVSPELETAKPKSEPELSYVNNVLVNINDDSIRIFK
ncbi:hypothetical protein J6590_094463 [Homalodisca vitripennis]|nr:hypothetical protein J6590_094463 [Homalodisca vitripennis]